MEKRITGIAVSPGIAIGKVYLFEKKEVEIIEHVKESGYYSFSSIVLNAFELKVSIINSYE